MACWTRKAPPNVGIILLNDHQQGIWGKRQSSTPGNSAGGNQHGETPEQAMFRELYEEID